MDTTKTKVSKVAAARRQLECAIGLWFSDKDAVSIHTLSAAAYQIIHDLNENQGPGKIELLYDTAQIKDEYRKEWINLIKAPSNFFKHADKDAYGIIEFVPAGSVMFMIFASRGLKNLGEQTSELENALHLFLAIHEPHLFRDEFRKTLGERLSAKGLHSLERLPKSQFLKEYLEARALQQSGRF